MVCLSHVFVTHRPWGTMVGLAIDKDNKFFGIGYFFFRNFFAGGRFRRFSGVQNFSLFPQPLFFIGVPIASQRTWSLSVDWPPCQRAILREREEGQPSPLTGRAGSEREARSTETLRVRWGKPGPQRETKQNKTPHPTKIYPIQSNLIYNLISNLCIIFSISCKNDFELICKLKILEDWRFRTIFLLKWSFCQFYEFEIWRIPAIRPNLIRSCTLTSVWRTCESGYFGMFLYFWIITQLIRTLHLF